MCLVFLFTKGMYISETCTFWVSIFFWSFLWVVCGYSIPYFSLTCCSVLCMLGVVKMEGWLWLDSLSLVLWRISKQFCFSLFSELVRVLAPACYSRRCYSPSPNFISVKRHKVIASTVLPFHLPVCCSILVIVFYCPWNVWIVVMFLSSVFSFALFWSCIFSTGIWPV